MNSLLLTLTILFSCLVAQAQDRDRKVNPEKLPSSISQYIDQTYPGHERVHYYTEKINDTLYYEAVFEQKGNEFNLLFNTEGGLYETERTLALKQLSNPICDSIATYCKNQFEKYYLIEVQEVELKGRLLYEIKVKGKHNGKIGFYELYFDRKGKFVGSEDVILNSIPSMF